MFNRFKISLKEKPIIDHVVARGTIDDPQGQRLVEEFIATALSDKQIRRITDRRHCDAEVLRLIYSEMIRWLIPNPCINAGGPMLAATLPYMEPARLETIIDSCVSFAMEFDELKTEEKIVLVRARAAAHAQEIKDGHPPNLVSFVKRYLESRSESLHAADVDLDDDDPILIRQYEPPESIDIYLSDGSVGGRVVRNSTGGYAMRTHNGTGVVGILMMMAVIALATMKDKASILAAEKWTGQMRQDWDEFEYQQFGVAYVHWLAACANSGMDLPEKLRVLAQQAAKADLPRLEFELDADLRDCILRLMPIH